MTELALMRIFIGEDDRVEGRPLYVSIVEALRSRGLAGATVRKAIGGFGRHHTIHSARSVEYSSNLPVVIEVLDSQAKIDDAVAFLRQMIAEGLVTLERVRAVREGAS